MNFLDMNHYKPLFLVCLILFSFIALNAQENPTKDEELSQILNNAGNYCERVKRVTLHYVCNENITRKIFYYKGETYKKRVPDSVNWATYKRLKVKGTKTNKWLYDYQLIKKNDELKEKRILLKRDKKNMHIDNAQLEVIKYIGKYPVYGPVGFLSRYWQDYFSYEIVGHDEIDGRKTIVIKSLPLSDIEENENYGKIWIDKKDFSILKIEWDSKSIKYYEEEIIPSAVGDLRKEMNWSITYGIDKNGVRFPSEQLIQEVLVSENGERFVSLEILFLYEDYQFFVVEVDVKY